MPLCIHARVHRCAKEIGVAGNGLEGEMGGEKQSEEEKSEKEKSEEKESEEEEKVDGFKKWVRNLLGS